MGSESGMRRHYHAARRVATACLASSAPSFAHPSSMQTPRPPSSLRTRVPRDERVPGRPTPRAACAARPSSSRSRGRGRDKAANGDVTAERPTLGRCAVGLAPTPVGPQNVRRRVCRSDGGVHRPSAARSPGRNRAAARAASPASPCRARHACREPAGRSRWRATTCRRGPTRTIRAPRRRFVRSHRGTVPWNEVGQVLPPKGRP